MGSILVGINALSTCHPEQNYSLLQCNSMIIIVITLQSCTYTVTTYAVLQSYIQLSYIAACSLPPYDSDSVPMLCVSQQSVIAFRHASKLDLHCASSHKQAVKITLSAAVLYSLIFPVLLSACLHIAMLVYTHIQIHSIVTITLLPLLTMTHCVVP